MPNKEKKHILVTDGMAAEGIQILKDAGFEVELLEDKSKLLDRVKNAHGLVVRSATKVNKKLLDVAEKLQIVARAGVGLDNIDLNECKKRSIEVVNSPEGPTPSVAEFTLALLIGAARKIGHGNHMLKQGKWAKKECVGVELRGKTLGVIGTGAIGGTVAQYALALGMNVLGYDVVIRDDLKALENFEYTDLDILIEESDFITLHVPLIPPTKHMLNKDRFEQMKDGVVIVNAARGGVINEKDLLDALNSGKVGAVGLDVFEEEPHPAPELISHPAVLATPHIGASTKEASIRNSTIVAEKIVKFFTSP